MGGEAALAAVSDRISALPEKEQEEDPEKEKATLGAKGGNPDDKIAMTATTEFCNVVQTPLEKMETMKHEAFRGSTLYKQQATQRKGIKASARAAARAAIGGDEANTASKLDEDDEDNTLKEDSL